MKPETIVQRAFSGGELSPSLGARADQAKYVAGLKTCRNFIVQRHGGVTNRPGLRYVNACKSASSTVMLLRYVSEIAGQSVLLEHGNGYLRFYVNGAQLAVDPATVAAYNGATNYVIGDLVISAGVVYWSRKVNVGVAVADPLTWWPLTGNLFELPSPFAADLPKWNQSGRIITFTHPNRAPWELINLGSLTAWAFRQVTTNNVLAAPVGLGVVSGGAGGLTIGYLVTASDAVTLEEGLPSGSVINAGVAAPTPAAPDVVSWTAVPGAGLYSVYQDPIGNGVFGFIGSTPSTSFKATHNSPDLSVTPPVAQVLFASAGNYPSTSAVYQQRRLFANTNNIPDAVYGSRTGFNSNYGVSAPLQNDDAITFRIAGNNHNPVRHMVALKGLIVLTDAGEWTVTGGAGAGSPLIPNGIQADQQTYVGCADVRPVEIGNSVVYVQARGKILRDLQFDLQVEGLGGRDLSIYSSHLFKSFTIKELDYQQTPNSVVWCVRSDGVLLGLTYVREQDVWAWHRHDTAQNATGAIVEHVCVVPEANEDVVYVITRRTINAAIVRYIERLVSRQITTFNTDAFFVDAGLSYHGAPVNNVAGLGHLQGQVVAVVGDGAVIFDGNPAAANAANFTITAGGTFPVVFPAAYSDIHVGLRVVAQLETLDLDVQGSDVRDKRKRDSALTLLLEDSVLTFQAGPDATHLLKFNLPLMIQPTTQYTGPAELGIISSFNDNGRVFIQHTDPLPLTILGILPNVEMGG